MLWQYGLGRSAVFTSDAKNRWAVNWLAWPGFDRLWANIFRDLLPHAPASEATADFDRANNELVVEYRLAHGMADPDKIPDIYALGPSGFQAPLKVDKVAAGHYRGRLPIGQNQGLFRIRPVADSRAFPEVGFYRQEDEMTEYGNNTELLADRGGHGRPLQSLAAAGLRRRQSERSGDDGTLAGPAGAGSVAESRRAGAAQVERRFGSAALGRD